MSVANDHRPAHRSGHDRRPATDVKRLRPSLGDDPTDRGVAGPPPGDLRMNWTDVLELAAVSRPPFERFKVDDQGDMGPLAQDERPVCLVEPSAADLAQSVDAALPRGPFVRRVSAPALRVHTVSQRREHGLPGLRVEVAVEPHHAQNRRGHLQAALFPETLGVLEPLLPVEFLTPVCDGVLELAGG